MEVISLDEDRVKIFDNYVKKKSNVNEYNSLNKANLMSKELNNITIDNTYFQIVTPKVYDFTNNIITMERCFGDNLELILRHRNTYNTGVLFLNNLLKFFIDNNFYWQDFAPRNILVQKNKISILDFDRGISDKVPSIQDYLVNSVYEEYGAFILPDDRIYDINDVYDSIDNTLMNISIISSNRVKTILKNLGYKDYVPIKDYMLAIKMIVTNETPYKDNEEIMFPILELEEYLKNEGYQKYAEKIIGGYYGKQKRI